ncbi:MAG: hypothetical protein ACKVOT_09970 [Polaromonas sp.]
MQPALEQCFCWVMPDPRQETKKALLLNEQQGFLILARVSFLSSLPTRMNASFR